MKRLIQLLAVMTALVAALYAPSAASPATISDGGSGPACADITGGGPVSLDTSGNLVFVVNTAKKSCSDIFYTVTAYPVDATGTVIDYSHPTTVVAKGTGFVDPIEGPQLFVTIPNVSGQFVCVSATTSDKQRHVFDVAPDPGSGPSCVVFDLSGNSSPFQPFH